MGVAARPMQRARAAGHGADRAAAFRVSAKSSPQAAATAAEAPLTWHAPKVRACWLACFAAAEGLRRAWLGWLEVCMRRLGSPTGACFIWLSTALRARLLSCSARD